MEGIFDEALLEQLRSLQELVSRVDQLAGVALRASKGDPVPFEDARWVERFVYEHLEGAVVTSWGLTQSVLMREAAKHSGSLSWFCAATFLLTHDFHKVVAAVPWDAWGCRSADTSEKRVVCMYVACWERIVQGDLWKLLAGVTLDPARLVKNCMEVGLIQERSGYYVLGPTAPRPRA